MGDLFDADAMYDDDYLHFLAPAGHEPGSDIHDARSDVDAEVIWRLLDLRDGTTVLDVGCGHGRIANRLADRGCHVTGLDFSAVFLERARVDATARGVAVDYVEGDMRALPWTERFDCVVSWSSAFGYFDDPVNRDALRQIFAVLRPGGRLAMDLNNLVQRLRTYQDSAVTAHRPDGMLVDRNHLDPLTGRLEVQRTVVRDRVARRLHFVVRMFAYPEIRDWLLATGFSDVSGHGEDGQPLTSEHERMIVTARKPGSDHYKEAVESSDLFQQ